jgi:hypothetical protein
MANSLVGAIIIAWTALFFVLIFSKIGSPKAAVFHVQVLACPMISFCVFRKSGMIFSWIGVGALNHFFSNAFSKLSDNHKSLNKICVDM